MKRVPEIFVNKINKNISPFKRAFLFPDFNEIKPKSIVKNHTFLVRKMISELIYKVKILHKEH